MAYSPGAVNAPLAGLVVRMQRLHRVPTDVQVFRILAPADDDAVARPKSVRPGDDCTTDRTVDNDLTHRSPRQIAAATGPLRVDDLDAKLACLDPGAYVVLVEDLTQLPWADFP